MGIAKRFSDASAEVKRWSKEARTLARMLRTGAHLGFKGSSQHGFLEGSRVAL